MRVLKSIGKMGLAVVAAFTLGIYTAEIAQAQYETSFSYSNPRTGFSYSQNVGSGYGSGYGGFSTARGNRSYTAGSGYYGQNYYQQQGFSSPNHNNNYQSRFGRGYYQGGSSYRRRR